MAVSSAVTAGDTVLATHYNNLRTDVVGVLDKARPKGILARTNNNLTCTHGTAMDIVFNSATWDTLNTLTSGSSKYWTTGASGTPPTGAKISITEQGLYTFQVSLEPTVQTILETVTLNTLKGNSDYDISTAPTTTVTHKFTGDVQTGANEHQHERPITAQFTYYKTSSSAEYFHWKVTCWTSTSAAVNVSNVEAHMIYHGLLSYPSTVL